MSKLDAASYKYMKAAAKRFRKSVNVTGESEFCAGFTWGAVAGYKAGHAAALRKRTSKNRGASRDV